MCWLLSLLGGPMRNAMDIEGGEKRMVEAYKEMIASGRRGQHM
jgi:hypothetical protein